MKTLLTASLSNQEKEIIKKFSNKLKTLLQDNLLFIKLFGSQVRGEATRGSDIDILIVLEERNLDVCGKIYKLLFDLDPYYEHQIALSIFSENEYKENERLGSLFIKHISEEAIAI